MGKGLSCALVLGVTLTGSTHTVPLSEEPYGEITIPKLKPVVEVYEYGSTAEKKITDSKRIFQANRVYSDEEKECLAKNIYFEAKNQGMKGQLAVAMVTMNRVLSPYYADNVCDVVYQRKQFSWYWDGKPDIPVNNKAFFLAKKLADAVLSTDSAFIDITDGADHYHADYVKPLWHKSMMKVVQVEAHIFYKAYDSEQSL